jgi:hypothetical protein
MVCGAVAFSALSVAPAALETLTPAPIRVLASARADEIVNACGAQIGSSPIFSAPYSRPYNVFGIKIENFCGAANGAAQYNLELFNDNTNQVAAGGSAGLIANAPPGLGIVQASVPSMSLYGTLGTGYVADMVWTGGQQRVDDAWSTYNLGFARPGVPGFGFTLTCAGPGSCPSDGAHIGMNQMTLLVDEMVPPSLAADAGSLWYEGSGGGAGSTPWVRGTWPLGFSASAPSGIASMSASMTGEMIGGPPAPPCWLPGTQPTAPFDATTQWQQCNNGQDWTPTVTLVGNRPEQLTLSATSVAGNTSPTGPYTESINVDTTQPQVSLTGLSEASSSAGTQYVTATAHLGPSGLGALDCTVDGGPTQSYSTSPAQVPVSGVGTHSIQCTASNRSVNPSGQVAVSTPATFSMDIGTPSASGVWFGKVIHAPKCRRVEERVKVAGKWVTVRRHGKLVRVHRRAHTKRVKARKCRERFVKRKVIELVKVKRHGKTVVVRRTKVEKVPLPPQAVAASTKRVAYGKGAIVSGILATTDGTAVPNRTVQILTAPNNQLRQWSQAAVVTTAADGTWSATLPAGPSRLVEAAYAGDNTTLPSTSNTVTLLVPARIKITITPRRLPWSGVLTIHGHLAGGYIPPDGVAMRVLIGLPHLPHPYLAQSFRTNAAGGFALKFKAFGGGHGVAAYPVWLATTSNESDYAYAKNRSRRLKVTFGVATPKPKARHRHRKNHKKWRRR